MSNNGCANEDFAQVAIGGMASLSHGSVGASASFFLDDIGLALCE